MSCPLLGRFIALVSLSSFFLAVSLSPFKLSRSPGSSCIRLARQVDLTPALMCHPDSALYLRIILAQRLHRSPIRIFLCLHRLHFPIKPMRPQQDSNLRLMAPEAIALSTELWGRTG